MISTVWDVTGLLQNTDGIENDVWLRSSRGFWERMKRARGHLLGYCVFLFPGFMLHVTRFEALLDLTLYSGIAIITSTESA